MTSKTRLHYRIIEELGRGGMGVVYKAHDTKLDRDVAIKFLPHHIAANAEERTRFRIEAKAAAALNHPNIATIYTIEEVDGDMFIVMEFIDGKELREIIKSEIPNPQSAIEYATQIAEGLKAAHAKGIIHRDIKSSNIMITESGQVKIMDFGLAKIAGGAQLTKDHSTLGTAAYMSPEQARGEKVDHRTDIWSFGVVLYEMLAGQLPFKGEKEPAIIYSILVEEPQPLSALRDDVPVELESIIHRALSKDVDERYQHMSEVLADLESVARENGTGKLQKRHNVLRQIGKKRAISFGLTAALVVLLVAAGLYVFSPSSLQIRSLAVLPFINVNADPELEYLSDGLSESLIRNLSQTPGLKVMSFNSVARYNGEPLDLHQIARDFNVRAILIGRFTQKGTELSISAELVGANDNRHLWGENYQSNLNDLLIVQDDITARVSEEVQPQLADDEKERVARRYTRNSEAYQLYLKGRFYAGKHSRNGFEKGMAYFQQAIEEDPNFALAYDGLAYYYIAGFEWMMSPREALPLAEQSARKALALDETLAEAHASLGSVYFWYYWDWPAAEREFQRALRLDPNYATTYQYFTYYMIAMKKFDRALAYMRRAQELKPLSLEINTHLGWVLFLAGHKEQALQQLNSTLDMDADFWFARLIKGVILETNGQLDAACAEFQQARAEEGDFSEALANLGRCYARKGMREEAQNILAELHRRAETKYIPPYFFFMLHRELGNKEEAVKWFEAAFDQRCIYVLWDKVFSETSLREYDSRLGALLAKVGGLEK